MVGSGIPALGLLLLMLGSVGEGTDKDIRGLWTGPPWLPYNLPTSPFFSHRCEWNPGIFLSME